MSPFIRNLVAADLIGILTKAAKTPEQVKRRERQEAAEFHASEMEEEYGPLSRDASFDERFSALEDSDPYTADRSEEIE